ncbi:hypothetical protein NDU88_001858 [Pleurodeles waltl]|uniref:Uncharacterized protein n=1 Tax=Pleurodeles waltl TaxID=8319 RepID=A0AAV7LZS6_PLEWA|nr:hypothetical protein NDU88_001858 [Pleurodeles waltl]
MGCRGGESEPSPHRDSIRVAERCAALCRSNHVRVPGAQQGIPRVAAPDGTGTPAEPTGPRRERRRPAGKGAPRAGDPQRGRSRSCRAAPGAPQGPAPQRQLRYRRWGASERSTAARSPGRESYRSPMPLGSPWYFSSSAPSARGPGAEPAHGPGQQLTSRGRGRRLSRPPAPPRRPRRPRSPEEDHRIGWWS